MNCCLLLWVGVVEVKVSSSKKYFNEVDNSNWVNIDFNLMRVYYYVNNIIMWTRNNKTNLPKSILINY